MSDTTSAIVAVLALIAALIIPVVLLLRTQKGEKAKAVRRARAPPRGCCGRARARAWGVLF